MKWTKEKPTRKGWYWYKSTKHDPAQIVDVYRVGKGLTAFGTCDWCEDLNDLGGQWSDTPIEPPAE